MDFLKQWITNQIFQKFLLVGHEYATFSLLVRQNLHPRIFWGLIDNFYKIPIFRYFPLRKFRSFLMNCLETFSRWFRAEKIIFGFIFSKISTTFLELSNNFGNFKDFWKHRISNRIFLKFCSGTPGCYIFPISTSIFTFPNFLGIGKTTFSKDQFFDLKISTFFRWLA